MWAPLRFGAAVRQKKLAIESKAGIVVLARYSSSRLPGKALMEIEGKVVLKIIMERLLKVVPRAQIVIATSSEESDQPIEEFARSRGYKVYRGSLQKVALRFFEAAQNQNWDYACRINGDNIFLEPTVLEEMLALAKTGQYDFISNVKGRSFPKGISAEIVRLSYYQRWLPQILADPYLTEHVMVYLYQRAEEDRHKYVYNKRFPGIENLDLALDTPEDLEKSKWIFSQFEKPQQEIGLLEISALAKRYEKLL